MPKDEKQSTDDQESSTVTVEFNGQKFTIPQDSDDWPTPAWIARVQASTTGTLLDWLKFVEQLVGPKQWKRLTDNTTKGDFKRFLDVFLTAVAKECSL